MYVHLHTRIGQRLGCTTTSFFYPLSLNNISLYFSKSAAMVIYRLNGSWYHELHLPSTVKTSRWGRLHIPSQLRNLSCPRALSK